LQLYIDINLGFLDKACYTQRKFGSLGLIVKNPVCGKVRGAPASFPSCGK
jgi:hypothetical protein